MKLKEEHLIPMENEIAVAGNVFSPRSIKRDVQTDLTEAIAFCGGVRADADRMIRVLKKSENGTYSREVWVDLRDLLTGRRQKLYLRPGDIVIVSNDKKKKALIRELPVPIKIPKDYT